MGVGARRKVGPWHGVGAWQKGGGGGGGCRAGTKLQALVYDILPSTTWQRVGGMAWDGKCAGEEWWGGSGWSLRGGRAVWVWLVRRLANFLDNPLRRVDSKTGVRLSAEDGNFKGK